MKKVLGLDLGTNSIGWAVVNYDENDKKELIPVGISSVGSRIIPMDAAVLGDFEKGETVSQTAKRTEFRSARRLIERTKLRRERLHRVLDLMNFLPEHYAKQLTRYGQFKDDLEPKLAWRKNESGKFEFIFKDSFSEMLDDFKQYQSQIIENNKLIPYDWTIYYLRKKALEEKISREELAWILLNFNQKRGYYQLRGEEDDEINDNKLVEFHQLKVVSVEATEEKNKDGVWYNVYLENGWIYRRTSKLPLDWVGKTKEFIVTTDLNDDGTQKTDKEGNIKRSFRAPEKNDWNLIKVKTEKEIGLSGKTVGSYIYDSILQKPDQKIRGKLVRTIERKFYKRELERILDKQIELQPELFVNELYQKCIEELYPRNEAHRNNISKPNFRKLFVDDIIFYQRPLKSKKTLINNCPFETRFDKDGQEHPVKCIAKSNPFYQEFRMWQFVANLKIYERETDKDVTNEFLPDEEKYIELFDWLNDRADIKQDTLLNSFFKIKKPKGKNTAYPYRWNYVEDKSYPCNETRHLILSKLKNANIDTSILSPDFAYLLWHILYSVEDKNEIEKALHKFADKNALDADAFVEIFKKVKPFDKEYGAYSEKAIKKLLPLMRMGRYWNINLIDDKTKERIDKIITGEYDDKIRDRVREKTFALTDISQFKGLPLWLASYIVYDRHSEAKDICKWEKPEDIDAYLKSFKQHSLRNPIVEQVVLDTLRVVRDIWIKEGHIDEIHVELGREMKNTKDKRKKMAADILENENTNLRIKAMLAEFANPEFGIDGVRPYSPSQQDILRIYEEGALQNLKSDDKDFDFINKISKTSQPSKNDVIRYKCWLEQKYRSPYTGEMISLTKLFTSDYEIEHIIPQSRYFDDSFSNKVICESAVNKLKSNQLGYEFIKNHHGEKVQLDNGKTVEIFSEEAYKKFVTDNYSSNRIKKKKLMLEDIPDDFVARQLNDSRYISKVVKGLLSNIVREDGEQEAISKNVITCNGSITDRLKKDWGMNDVWNSIVFTRFERLNRLTGQDCFTSINSEGHPIPNMPLELQKGFNKKRIDHRHHAMDAIVIACTTRNHVNLLNNESALSKNKENRYALSHKLRVYEEVVINGEKRKVPKEFIKPWTTFTQDSKTALENIIVSFKQNLRIINKTVNKIEHYDDNGKKVLVRQTKGDSWTIRKSMHKDTVFGEVNLRFIKTVTLNEAIKNPKRIVNKDFKKKVIELLHQGKDGKGIKKYVEDNKDIWSDINPSKIEIYYYTKETNDRYFATRFLSDLVGYFANVTKEEEAKKKINAITDTGIQKILKAHLQANNNNPEIAFSPDGIDEMNKNIIQLNNGKFHQPIYKVRRYEKADKYSIGVIGNKKSKFVEADKGTNLFFAVFAKKDNETHEILKERSYLTIGMKDMIDCQIQYGKLWRNKLLDFLKEKELIHDDLELLFVLSPNDLVYVPTEQEMQDKKLNSLIDKNRIYKMVSSSGRQSFFIKVEVAKSIVDKQEFSKLNKMERALSNEMIKDVCIPIKVDRLGNITKIGYE